MLQKILLGIYKLICRTGLFNTSAGQKLFYKFYFLYKEFYEAKNSNYLKRYVPQGSSVVDVGANAGFFTKKFANWVLEGGKVLAFEPDEQNLEQLKANLRELIERVIIVNGVAGNKNGTVEFQLDPYHPAGHKINSSSSSALTRKTENGNNLIEVNSYTIDEVLNRNQNLFSQISLIKIDVQGAEKMVLEGAEETINKFHPSLFVEIDEEALNEYGTNTSEIIEMLKSRNYTPFYIDKKNKLQEIDIKVLSEILDKREYIDLLFLQNITS
jgi:FkbM family methyltransferase